MNTRFYNIRLLTMDGTMDVVPGEVWVEGTGFPMQVRR